MNLTLKSLETDFSALGIEFESFGAPNLTIHAISAVEKAKRGDMVFVDKKEFIAAVAQSRPSLVVTTAELKPDLARIEDISLLIVKNVPLAHALIKKLHADRDYNASGWSGIHAAAFVDPSAIIAENVVIEPKAVIGARVKIKKNSRIMAGAIIEHDAEIGESCTIHPNVVIGYACKLGNEVEIASGTVIGSQGFGFAQDQQRKSYPIPQTGIVVIEDRVRVGANCCIDRATYHETRIGAGSKFDNLCHVAHNVKIGKDCLLTAMLCVAGSSQIGDRVITSGQVGILDHVRISNDVVLLHRAGVAKDIEKPGLYAGVPLLPLVDYMKNSAVLKNAADLRKRILKLEETTEKSSSEL